MIHGIYGIFHKSGKTYIGSAIDLRGRFISHKSLLKRGKHTSIHLQRAWNKDKSKSFKFKLLEKVNKKEDLLKREQYWLDKYKSHNGKFGYNICKVAGSSLGCKASKKTKKLLSKAKKGKKFTDEHKTKISKALKQYKRTEKHNKNISKSLTGLLVGDKNPYILYRMGTTRYQP